MGLQPNCTFYNIITVELTFQTCLTGSGLKAIHGCPKPTPVGVCTDLITIKKITLQLITLYTSIPRFLFVKKKKNRWNLLNIFKTSRKMYTGSSFWKKKKIRFAILSDSQLKFLCPVCLQGRRRNSSKFIQKGLPKTFFRRPLSAF